MVYLSFLATLLVLLCAPEQAVAQDSGDAPLDTSKAFSDHQPLLAVTRREPVFPEEVGMLFHKMIGQDPDFDSWASQSPRVQEAKMIDRNSMYIQEYNRMKRAYRTFDEGQILPIHVEARISEYSDMQNILLISEFNERTYFSYHLYGQHYAIIPAGIEQFNMLSLTPDEYRAIRELLGETTIANAEILIRPKMADGEQTMELNNKDHWLIMADIMEIRFWGPQQQAAQLPTAGLGWFYRNPDYKPETDNELMDLFSE